jgi:hypothetical protein
MGLQKDMRLLQFASERGARQARTKGSRKRGRSPCPSSRRPTAGDFEFQWAQNFSDAGSLTVVAGNYVEYLQVT